MKNHLARTFLLLALATGPMGCVYRVPPAHLPDFLAVPAAGLDVAEVQIVDHHPTQVDTDTPEDAWQDTVQILAGAARERPASGALPARVRVRIDRDRRGSIFDSMRTDGIASIGLFFLPFGFVMDNEKISVDVTIEHAGRTFTGHGSAEKLGSMYAPARRRALAVALDRALADASTKNP
jgi:hypothetical protein